MIIRIVDIGAGGKAAPPYQCLLDSGAARVEKFEPQHKLHYGDKMKPLFIGDGTRQTFYRCSAPMVSSLLEPDPEVWDIFGFPESWCKVIETSSVPTHRLDDMCAGADLIKIDIQGGEVMAFAGAPLTLGMAVVVHVEVSFIPMYHGQPLHGDIDTILRQYGFYFHKFYNNGAHWRNDQWLWGDAIYVRDYRSELTPAQRLAMSQILREVYGSPDFADCISRPVVPC